MSVPISVMILSKKIAAILKRAGLSNGLCGTKKMCKQRLIHFPLTKSGAQTPPKRSVGVLWNQMPFGNEISHRCLFIYFF